VSAKDRRYYSRHKKAIKEKQLTPEYIYLVLKGRMKKKNLDIATKEDFIDWYNKQERKCVYCGISEGLLDEYMPNGKIRRLSIDRMENGRGYEVDNMVLCCMTCNRVKGEIFSFKEMKRLAEEFITPKWQISL
jgi:hypothetical protein